MYSVTTLSHRERHPFSDLVVLILVAGCLYGVVATARLWHGALTPNTYIDLSLIHLPLYALYSLSRAIIAYFFSLGFTLTLGYLAAKNRTAEQFILPMLDIGQSIPVLGFLPGLVLGLIAVFPHRNFGLELACIILIFTGQVWNMTFSFYSSLKGIPHYFYEMADVVGMNWTQRFLRIEMPYAATGLAWNSLLSMAGGWFFLTVCESFTLEGRNFRVPGLGSYMALAIDNGNRRAMIAAVIMMLFVIVAVDFIVWRPIVAWTGKFRLEDQADSGDVTPFMSLLLSQSELIRQVIRDFLHFNRKSRRLLRRAIRGRAPATSEEETGPSRWMRAWIWSVRRKIPQWIVGVLFALFAFWVIGELYRLMRGLALKDYILILKGTGFTFLRVLVALIIATLWALPAAIWIGLSTKRTRIFQPIIQAAASFPAPMLYPIALGVLYYLNVGLGTGSAFLMLLGVQWYVLFNVLAGAVSLSQDLQESFRLAGASRWRTWTQLYIPSVFPTLVTGWVTAAGGAWNASIVAEYIQYGGKMLKTTGLGAVISEATASGNFSLLAGSLVVMVLSVVGINRLVWRPIYRLAETRYRFER